MSDVYGPSVKNSFIIEEDLEGCHYYFKSDFVCGGLLKAALVHNDIKRLASF
jgi:hypothetical protein